MVKNNFPKKSLTMTKKTERGPLGFFNIHFIGKPKEIEEGPFEEHFFGKLSEWRKQIGRGTI